ncbi:Rz1-like lysis system protein LysC [Entomohabitans teleogrylli]|uniref:Rz1-like lysis system protein LysC n=1 Tax=Entomohabitans teleogrylli TaxID=1384589 RepID=UPI003B83366B
MRTVYVQAPHIPIPESLTEETPQPEIPKPLTWGGSLVLNVETLAALAQCNADKRAIRGIEEKKAQ